MLETSAALYLPISYEVLDRVLDDEQSLPQTVSELPLHQAAALVVVQCVYTFRDKGGLAPERMLAEMIELGNAREKLYGAQDFTAEVLRVLDREKIRRGSELLPDHRIVLLDEQTLAYRSYLTAEGCWDSTFTRRHREKQEKPLQSVELPGGEHRVLSLEQTRIFREVRAQTDDHLHVQGYAGTGKSSLIKCLMTMLASAGARVLVLAERQTQLEALMAGFGELENVSPKTFDKLMDEVIPRDATDPVSFRMRGRRGSRTTPPDDEVIRGLGIRSSGRFSPQELVRVVRGIVWSFCHSGDGEIGEEHVPGEYAIALDATARQVTLHHATEFWKAILLPRSRDFSPPARSYHRIKWASLNDWPIPSYYTHVLIDECHDLAKPMLRILDRSPQAVISLGDEYQNLQGRPAWRSSVVRQREVTRSVRSGTHVESVVNPIIASHPGNTKLPFQGNPFNRTEISYYDSAEIPERPAVVLVGDEWGLFEWAQRLAQKSDFQLLSNAVGLNTFVNDLIELYVHGTRPRHIELFRFGTWDTVSERHQARPGFQRIERMLSQGYRFKDWQKTEGRIVAQSEGGHALGRVEDVRNREFDAVMLAPDVVDWAWETRNIARAEAASALYVAVTRAKHHLIVPGKIRSWIEEIGKT